MTKSDAAFGGSIADVYDELLVPLIFERYAADLGERAEAIDPQATLEVAAGSGVVARAVAPRLGRSARYVVTDLNPPMLQRAASRQKDPDRIEWQQADALDLPFEANGFDLMVCQFGAMFFPDRVKAYTEARRVLQPGGSFVFSMWDRIEENDFALAVSDALAGVFPHDPPRFLARTPHGHHDPEVFEQELYRAGFSYVALETLDAISVASSPSIPAIAYCHGTPLRNEIGDRSPSGLDEASNVAADEVRNRFGPAEVTGRIRAFVITAT